MLWIAIAMLLALEQSRPQAPSERALSAFSEDGPRQFDFWVGEWEVNLRMMQDDASFSDSVSARAHIYSILGDRAILELWDSTPIKGYSLRYFDPSTRAWVLWLNWPGPDRSRPQASEAAFDTVVWTAVPSSFSWARSGSGFSRSLR